MRVLVRSLVCTAAASLLTLPSVTPATASTFTPPSEPCIVGKTVEANGRSWTCVESNGVATWLDLGHTAPPLTTCAVGRVSQFNGYSWTCVLKNGQPIVVKTKPLRRPASVRYGHTSSRSRHTMDIAANVPLDDCRLTVSDPRLLKRTLASLSGRTARRTLDTSGLRAGVYTIQVSCRDRFISQSGDLLVRPNGSVLLRSDCLDAWHDSKYADIVPGYGRRLKPADVSTTMAECRRLAPRTLNEMDRESDEAFLRIGQIAEREVRRVSAERGIPICAAIGEVFHPVDALGRRSLAADPAAPASGPIAGYLADGFFPILYRQWRDSPFRLKNTAGCGSGNQGLRLYTTMWAMCPNTGSFSGFDLQEMYPAFDASLCPPSVAVGDRPSASVCIVWGDEIGNDVVGGVGKVFMANGELPNDSFDCQDRYLGLGTFVNVKDRAVPPLE
jgi:hypothetical protein